MSNEFLAIIVMIAIVGVVTIAWRIRAESDKSDKGQKRKPELSEAAKRRQMQASIERLERKQTEISSKLDQILEARPKAVKMTVQKTTKTRKTTGKPKTKNT
ncbi:MAG: hypothetical protein AABY49_04700 [Planctomycetota bacterium]